MPGTAAAPVPWGSAAAIRLCCLCSDEYLNRAINISEHIHPNEKSTSIREKTTTQGQGCSLFCPSGSHNACSPFALNKHLRASNTHEHSSSYFANKQKHREKVVKFFAFRRVAEQSYQLLCFHFFWGLWLLGIVLTLEQKIICFEDSQGCESSNTLTWKNKDCKTQKLNQHLVKSESMKAHLFHPTILSPNLSSVFTPTFFNDSNSTEHCARC